MKKNILVFFLGCFLAFILLEVILRIYNPFPSRVIVNRINLPIHQKYTIMTGRLDGIGPIVVHRKNSLGFRGPEMPDDFKDRLSIIAVGGSTTECILLSDTNDWPSVLERLLEKRYPRVWVNNAGLDGHSTFGHQILIDDYIARLHPRVVLFLVGCNEIGNDRIRYWDTLQLNNTYAGFKNFIGKHSAVVSTVVTVLRKSGLWNKDWSHRRIVLQEQRYSQINHDDAVRTLQDQKRYCDLYAQRLEGLIDTCRKDGIDPVFITQPALYGEGIDPRSGVDLARIAAGPGNNGALSWKILEMYNDVTRRVCSSKGVYLIDLALTMIKDSRYYYDYMHYTAEGSEKVAQIVASALEPYLDAKYPQFKAQ